MFRFLKLFGIVTLTACAAPESGLTVNHPHEKQPLYEAASDDFRSCYESEASQKYLAKMHSKIIEAWDVAYGTRKHAVLVRLTLRDSGEVNGVQILESPSEAFGTAAMNAVQSAQPFDSVPAEASCLTTRSLRLRFETHR